MTAANPRWRQRPEGSTWGDFGPDDQIGRLNLLTPERRRAAAAEVREGRAFCLSLPLDYPGGNKMSSRRHPPRLTPTDFKGQPFMNQSLRATDARNTDVICDDQVTLCLQYSTQWDSFAHVGSWFDADGDGEPEVRTYKVAGELFFATSNDLVYQFDYAGDPRRVVIDLSESHIWDASTVAALDAVQTKYERLGKEVEIVGLNWSSAARHEQLTGQLGEGH